MTLLELHFPPSFFDIMTHLLYHLVDELDMCGLVSTRWMYPIERYMKTLKHYVQNMARSEACMAEGYARDEYLGFIRNIYTSLKWLTVEFGMYMKSTEMQRRC